MRENLFIAGMICLALVIYASIYLNIDLRIQTNAHCPSQSYFRVILEGFIGITNNLFFFPPQTAAFEWVTFQRISSAPSQGEL